MMKQLRTVLLLTTASAIMGLVGCGHYNCNTDEGLSFSGSGCSSGSPSGAQSGSGSGSGSVTGAFVFAVDTGTGAGGTIDGFTLNTSGSTFQATASYTAPVIPQNDGGIGMVVAQKQFLYTGFSSADQIYGWTIDSTGNLTAATGSPYSAPFLSSIGGEIGMNNIVVNPAGTLMFISVSLTNRIYAYQIGSGGALTAVTGSPFSVPFPPLNLAIDGLGKYLYAVNGDASSHTGSQVAAFVIGTSTSSPGALTAVPGSPFAYPMWQVQGEPTGQFLIGTSGKTVYYSGTDDDHLYVYSITQSGSTAGAITPVSNSPFTTIYAPFSIAVSPNSGGNQVYSFGFNDTATGFNSAEGFQIGSSGALTEDSGSPFSGLTNGSWGQFDQSGTLLLDYGSFFNLNTDTMVTQISPFDVGSGGALTQPFTSLTLATQGFWVVTDPQ